MIVKWFHQVISGTSHESTAQGAIEEEKRTRLSRDPIDVPHRVLSEEAAKRSSELGHLVRSGWPWVKRERVKKKVRQKVWDVVSKNFEFSNDDMVDEITEKIVDAAEVDPTYQKMFRTDEAE